MANQFATYIDLEDRWRPLTPDEQVRAAVLLNDASADIRLAAPNVDARIASYSLDPLTIGALDPIIPMAIACAMVKRAMAAGGELEGVSSTSVTTGPFGNSFNYSNPLGNLYLSKSERKRLGAGGQVAFTIDQAPSAGLELNLIETDWT